MSDASFVMQVDPSDASDATFHRLFPSRLHSSHLTVIDISTFMYTNILRYYIVMCVIYL